MADKLVIYNNAIILCGGEMLAALDDATKARRLCDQAWDGVVTETVEAAAWKAFMRTVSLSADSDFTVEFGYDNAFTQTDDWRRTYIISASETLDPPLNDYLNEGGFIYANPAVLFCRFVSDGAAYGGDLGLWSALFARAVETRLAERICPNLTESEQKLARITSQADRALAKARSIDAFREGVKQPPAGSWVSSRVGCVGRGPQGDC